MNGKVIIFSAPSGAGKTTIARHILQNNHTIEFSISAASRPMRANEINGKDYYFLTAEDFKKKIANNEFIEWQEVYANCFYGTLKSEIERIWSKGHHIMFDVDTLGGRNLKSIFKNQALSIFIKPPSIQILEERLRNRQTETEENIIKRMSRAEFEISFAEEFDVIIVNENLEQAILDTQAVIKQFIG